MKKISEWLKTISDTEVRDKALLYMSTTTDDEVDSLPMALKSAFIWDIAPEGYFYWLRIHDGFLTPSTHQTDNQ